MSGACQGCLARTWLLQRLAGNLEVVRARITALLGLADHELLAAVAGGDRDEVERELAAFDARGAAAEAAAAGLELLCRCQPEYPSALRDLPAPPAVLHVAGGMTRFLALCSGDPVAVVGSRRASSYGVEMARTLGRGLGAAGITVVSGMARGIDGAAHRGALQVDGPTLAVLPGAAQRPYPASHRGLWTAIVAGGAAVAELGPTAGVWRWCFLARNRLIAALSALTVVVEAGEGSGALPTAATARRLGRATGAVPGRVTSPQAAGPNGLLASGAVVIRSAQDVLDQLYGIGQRDARSEERGRLEPEQEQLLAALANGQPAGVALSRAGIGAERGLAVLAELELAGWVRRGTGGGLTVVP